MIKYPLLAFQYPKKPNCNKMNFPVIQETSHDDNRFDIELFSRDLEQLSCYRGDLAD